MIATLILRIPTPIAHILILIPRITIIPTLIPCIPILIPRIPMIPLIPFPDSLFWFLQITGTIPGYNLQISFDKSE